MRKKLLLLCSLVASLAAYSQAPVLYHRVKITTGEDGLRRLAAAGVATDHGDVKKGAWFVSDFSDAEVELIRQSGLPYEIQIDDVARYYEERNKDAVAEKPFGAEGCDACDVYATPLNFTLGTMGGFYKYQEMLDALDSMRSKYPDLITVRQAVSPTLTTIEGRPVYYVRISDHADQQENEPEVLYTALHHAREAESLSQLIFYMWYLLEHYNSDSYVKYLVDHTQMYFIPCINPDGYIYNQTTNPNGGGMWRKNRRDNGDGTFGVDLNRNYGNFWGYDNEGSSPNGSNETYRGTAGFSEPETQMVRDFCNAHGFSMALNAHTYSNLLIYPWGHVPSMETPDSTAFRHFAADMASCSGFVTGTGDQTVGYVSNGDSDDWMYGEQSSKEKIFSMTPEAGKPADGFWPTLQRIIPIAKQTVDQNLDVAKYATAFAEAVSTDGPFMQGGTGYVHFDFKRTGLAASDFTVSLAPVTQNISFGNSRSYAAPALLEQYSDSIAYNMSTAVTSGEMFRFVLRWENADGFTHSDTIVRYLGPVDTAFASDGNSMNGFTGSTGWGVSTGTFVSPAGSLTDSPNGNYSANSNNALTTSGPVDLTGASAAFLTFAAKWDIERGYDDVTVEAAPENGSYTVLCGRFNHLGNSNQNNRKAVYDGTQSEWLREYIDLKDYLGKKISFRFVLHSDPGVQKDGIYVDDLQVLRTGQANVGIREPASGGSLLLQNVPNPCYGSTDIIYRLPQDQERYSLKVTDQVGRVVLYLPLDRRQESVHLDVSRFTGGVYFYSIVSGSGKTSQSRKMVLLK